MKTDDEGGAELGGADQDGLARHHLHEAKISDPSLDERGGVFFAAVEMTRMPMILTDPSKPDNPIVFANRAFQDLTGYAEAEIVGRNCRFLQGPQSDPETVREMREAVREGRPLSAEVLNYRRDGTPFWNAAFIAPVLDRAGKLLYFFASQLDVSRRRNSEQAFRQAQKMEAIGQLTAGLAHDFNNMLQVISGNLDLALAKIAGDEGVRRHLENAGRAAERGAKLTRQLLAFARKTRLEPRTVNLNSLAVEFGEMLETTLGDAVELELRLKPRLPSCSLDPVHLEMALLNVLINARDAMPEGGTVTVETRAVCLGDDDRTAGTTHQLPPGPGDYVVLAVTDTGHGMPRDVLERATEPFFTTKGVGKGTGLGLAMAHGFVRQSRGRLEIESEVGRGTTVRMLFPVAAGAPEAPDRRRAPPAADEPQGAEPRGRAETVLVVEDSEDVLALAVEHLEALGYRALTARSGEEALRPADGHPGEIDLLFTDLVMPGGMNGLELAAELERRRPGLPVLLTTGYNEDLVADGPPRPGMDVLGKPYRRAELGDRVRAVLDRRIGKGKPPSAHPVAEG